MDAGAGTNAAPSLLGRHDECAALDRLLTEALGGRAGALVLRGEAGVGKSALLRYLSGRVGGWRVVRAVGIESELELPYSSLHQICAPMLDELERLPAPQRQAIATVFGLRAGDAPDRFLVALATLTLLAEVAEQQPLVCIVDDAQWLDRASMQIVGFVARRLLAERIVIVCAARAGTGEDVLAGLPELRIGGLDEDSARSLLLDNVYGPLDARVCERILAESHGNPLALLELPRTATASDLAGGFGLPDAHRVTGRIERSYARRLDMLPSKTQLLVLAAAAEPLGDPVLLHRAAATLDTDIAAVNPAVDAGLITVDTRVEFAHPIVRSVVYRSATAHDREWVHRALAEATDPAIDPDRRDWHRAHATLGPDEDLAAELESSAGRAQARGGFAAAAAFLERAAMLSPDPHARSQRALAAAEAKQLAGAPEAAATLLASAVAGPLDELETALAQRRRGLIAIDLRRPGEGVPFLLDAAGRLESIEPRLARETCLEALRAASLCGRLAGELLTLATEAARAAPPADKVPRAVDLLVDGLALRFSGDYASSAGPLKLALRAVRDEDDHVWQDVRRPGFAARLALDLFDDDACDTLATRSVQLAREQGALGVLPLALHHLANFRCFEGSLDVAESLADESDAIADATGTARFVAARLTLAGFRGDEAAVSALSEDAEPLHVRRGEGIVLTYCEHARARLYNGLGWYDAALPAAESASAREDEQIVSTYSLPELVEAAMRCGKREVATAALARLGERTQAAGTELALGIEARSRALLSDATAAETLYREAVERLGRCRLRPERARAHLLYGEWLRREGRRVDAREQLRTAHDTLVAIGMNAFAERARRELIATGEKARRTTDSRDDLTPQEAQIAHLARAGHTNPEIGAQLFLSPRTIEWHLRRVYSKLGISSRGQLRRALADEAQVLAP